jgi:hypothetical protein
MSLAKKNYNRPQRRLRHTEYRDTYEKSRRTHPEKTQGETITTSVSTKEEVKVVVGVAGDA